MHIPHVRNWIFLAVVILVVVSAKDELVNVVFSIFSGIWVMVRSFKFIFSPLKDSSEFRLDRFIPEPRHVVSYLLFGPERKLSFMVVVWWAVGILTTMVTYKLLGELLLA